MRHLLPCILLIATAAAMSACNIVGPAFVILHGPEKLPAEYTLDEDKKTVVFVDDRSNIVSRRSARMRIAEEAEEVIAEKGLVKEMVRSQAIMAAASQDSHAEPSSIAELGRSVGADVVIYATVDYFGLSPDGATYQPTARFRVKVIETENGERLWPAQVQGHNLVVQMEVRPEDLPQNLSEALERESMLAEWAGKRLAELFFDHVKPNESRVGRPAKR